MFSQISPTHVRYIKLGEAGSWEHECLQKGIIRIGFYSAQPDRFDLCQRGLWPVSSPASTKKRCARHCTCHV